LRINGAATAVNMTGGSRAILIDGIDSDTNMLGAITLSGAGVTGTAADDIKIVGGSKAFSRATITNSQSATLEAMTIDATGGNAVSVDGTSDKISLHDISILGSPSAGVRAEGVGVTNLKIDGLILGAVNSDIGNGIFLLDGINGATINDVMLRGVTRAGFLFFGAENIEVTAVSNDPNGGQCIGFSMVGRGVINTAKIGGTYNGSTIDTSTGINFNNMTKSAFLLDTGTPVEINNVTITNAVPGVPIVSLENQGEYVLGHLTINGLSVGDIGNAYFMERDSVGISTSWRNVTLNDVAIAKCAGLISYRAQAVLLEDINISGTTIGQATDNIIKLEKYLSGTGAIESKGITITDSTLTSNNFAMMAIENSSTTDTSASMANITIKDSRLDGFSMLLARSTPSGGAITGIIDGVAITGNTISNSANLINSNFATQDLNISGNAITNMTGSAVGLIGVAGPADMLGINIDLGSQNYSALQLSNCNNVTLAAPNIRTAGIGIRATDNTRLSTINNAVVTAGTGLSVEGLTTPQTGAAKNLTVNGFKVNSAPTAISMAGGSRAVLVNGIGSDDAMLGVIALDGAGTTGTSADDIKIIGGAKAFSNAVINNSKGVTLQNVSINRSADAAIRIAGGSNKIVLTDPILTGAATVGVWLQDSYDVTARGVNVFGVPGGSFDVKTAAVPGIAVSDLYSFDAGRLGLLVQNITLDVPATQNYSISIKNSGRVVIDGLQKAAGINVLAGIIIDGTEAAGIMAASPLQVNFIDMININNFSYTTVIQNIAVNLVERSLPSGTRNSAVLLDNILGARLAGYDRPSLVPDLDITASAGECLTISNSRRFGVKSPSVRGGDTCIAVRSSGANEGDSGYSVLVVEPRIGNSSSSAIRVDASESVSFAGIERYSQASNPLGQISTANTAVAKYSAVTGGSAPVFSSVSAPGSTNVVYENINTPGGPATAEGDPGPVLQSSIQDNEIVFKLPNE
jgi:hypothetical protein